MAVRRCATIYGAELSLGLTTPQNGVADPEGSHLLVLARGVRGLPPAGRGDHRGAAARRREGPAALRPRGAGRAGRRPLGDPDRLPQGPGPAGADRRRSGGGRRRAGPADRAVRPRPRGGRADRPRPAHRLRRPTTRWPRWPPITACPWWPPTTCTSPRPTGVPAGRGDGRGPGPAQPGRDGRLAAGPRSPSAVRGWRWRCGSPATPGRWPASVELADECAFDLRLAKPAAAQACDVPAGHTPISWLRELCRRGADERYPDDRARGRGPAAARAGGDRGEGLPGLLPDRARHGRLRPRPRDPLPGPGIGGQLGGLLRARHHRGRPDHVPTCRSSGSCPPPATRSPTSTSTSTPTGARR